MLNFLQENSQWICGMGMMFFAGVQAYLMREQKRQQLRLKRLEFANNFCNMFAHFPYDKNTCNQMMNWLLQNKANFRFLLRKKDFEKYWKLCDFIFDLQQQQSYSIGDENTNMNFFKYVHEMEKVLGNAKYGISTVKYKNKITYTN